MSRFALQRDIKFFQSISRELVDAVIDNIVTIYKMSTYETRTNIYGESLNKLYLSGVDVAALIERNDTETNYEGGYLPDVAQTVTFRFNRFSLEEIDVYLEIGDIIYHNDAYFEISNVREDQLIGGRPEEKYSVVVETFMSRISTLQIEERIL